MASPINTFPRGLLALLGAQTGGRTPQELESSVRAALEMWQFYQLALEETPLFDTTGVITAVLGNYPNLSGILTVPQNELWYVRDFVAQSDIVLPAGEQHTIALAKFTVGAAGAGITAFTLQQRDTMPTGTHAFQRALPPFWLRAGNRLGLFLTNVVAPTSTVSYVLKATVTRLSI